MTSTVTERPPVRFRRLPAGVTESFSQVTYRPIERPANGAHVYRHVHNDRDTFTIDGLSADEANRIMVMLLNTPGLDYLGIALGRAIYPNVKGEDEK